MKKLSMVLLSACLCIAPAFAATPSKQSATKLAQLQDIDKQFEMVIKTIIQEPIYDIEDMIANSSRVVSDEQKKRIDDIFEKYTTQIAHSVMTKEFKEQNLKAFIKSVQEHYTQAEVDAYNAFLSTKEGKSIVQKQDKIYADYMALFDDQMGDIMGEILSLESNQLIKKMFEEVQAVLGE